MFLFLACTGYFPLVIYLQTIFIEFDTVCVLLSDCKAGFEDKLSGTNHSIKIDFRQRF
jgi:hypothetical protein